MSDRRVLILAGAFLAAVVLVTFAPALFDRLVAVRDLPRFTLPDRAFWAAQVAAGELPEWNPLVGLGVPLLAAPVHGSFYPGNLLLLLGDVPRMLTLQFALHAWLAGLGGFVLARALGARPSAALVAGLVLAIGGYAVAMWGNGEKVLSGAWLPWSAVGALAAARAERAVATRIVVAALPLALVALAGDPFLWLHAALLAGPLVFAAARAPARRTAPRMLAVAGLAIALAGPSLVPALAVVGASERAGGVDRATAEVWSTAPRDALGLVVPGAPHSSDPTMGQAWAATLYVGVAALAALAAGRARVALALWASGAVALLLAFGGATPVHELARRAFPPLAYARYPEKFAAVTVAALALLAALGWERLIARLGPRVRRLAPILPVVVAADLFIAAAPHLSWLDADQVRVAPPLVAAMQMGAGAGPAGAPDPEAGRGLAVGAPGGPPLRVYRARWPDPSQGALDTVPHNVGTLFGLAHVPGHDPGQPRHVRALWEALGERGELAVRLLGIDYVVAASPRGWGLRRTPSPIPRVVALADVRVLADDEALRRIAGGAFDPAREAVVAPGPHARPLGGGAADVGTCAIAHYAARRVSINCEVAGEALAVMSDAFADGWSAELDGAAAPLVRADVALRGVYLPAGRHVIELRFATPGLGVGLAIGGLAALLALALVARDLRRRAPPACHDDEAVLAQGR